MCASSQATQRAHSEPDEPQARWAVGGRMLRSQWRLTPAGPRFLEDGRWQRVQQISHLPEVPTRPSRRRGSTKRRERRHVVLRDCSRPGALAVQHCRRSRSRGIDEAAPGCVCACARVRVCVHVVRPSRHMRRRREKDTRCIEQKPEHGQCQKPSRASRPSLDGPSLREG